jgi:hypothetical protein
MRVFSRNLSKVLFWAFLKKESKTPVKAGEALVKHSKKLKKKILTEPLLRLAFC